MTNALDIEPGVWIDYESAVTHRGAQISTGRRTAVVAEVRGRTVRAVTNTPRPGVVKLDPADIVQPLRWARIYEVNRLLQSGAQFGFSTSGRHVKRALWATRAAVRAHKKGGRS